MSTAPQPQVPTSAAYASFAEPERTQLARSGTRASVLDARLLHWSTMVPFTASAPGSPPKIFRQRRRGGRSASARLWVRLVGWKPT